MKLELTPQELAALKYRWRSWAREKQRAPAGDWLAWLILSGRGFGKTRTGAEWVRQEVEAGRAKRIALVGQTVADARGVMVTGPSGLLACCPPWNKPTYNQSKRTVTWPNGAGAITYSGDKPSQLRGPEHDLAWVDELCKMQYPDDIWSNLMFGLRMGEHPRVCVTTTPRPIQVLRDLLADKDTRTVKGSSYENLENLAPPFRKILETYEGTRTGRQEIHAELLDDIEGAIVTMAMLDDARVKEKPESMDRVVVAVDPAVSAGENSDETGIVVCGRSGGAGYVLADATGSYSPGGWARRVLRAYDRWKADAIICEVNNGGDLVEHTIRTERSSANVVQVRASRGKHVRFAPVGALYERGLVRHVGMFADLEDQVRQFTNAGYEGDASPDRADALVWGMTDLLVERSARGVRVWSV